MLNNIREIKNCLVNIMGRFPLSVLSFTYSIHQKPRVRRYDYVEQSPMSDKELAYSRTTEVLPVTILMKTVADRDSLS